MHNSIGRIRILKSDTVSKGLLFSMLLLLAHAVITSVIYSESIILSLYSYRYTLLLPIIYFYTLYYDKWIYNTGIIKLIIGFAYLQIPFAVAKYFIAGGGELNTLDSVTGHLLHMISCGMSSKCNSNYYIQLVVGKKAVFRVNHTIAVLLLLVPLVLSKSRLASLFVMIAVGLGLLIPLMRISSRRVSVRRVMYVLCLSVLISAILYKYFWVEQDYDLEQHSSSEYVWDYLTRQGSDNGNTTGISMGRIQSIITASKLVSESPVSFLFGFSPASAIDARFLGAHGRYYQSSGALDGLGRTQYSRMIMSLGFLGLITMFYSVHRVQRQIASNYGKRYSELHEVTPLLFLLFLLLSGYTITLYHSYYSALYGVTFAIIQLEQRRVRRCARVERILQPALEH